MGSKVVQLTEWGKKWRKNMNSEVNIFNIAEWFLNKEPMTHKKLQKMCYYAYAWYLTLYKDYLFEEYFYAWIHGPVNKKLYDIYKSYGWNPINIRANSIKFDEKTEEFLNMIYDNFGVFSADQLEYMTHQERPWQMARRGLLPNQAGNEPIKDDDIINFYSSLLEGAQVE